MTTKQITFRPIIENKRRIRICEAYKPNANLSDPLIHGIYLWLREQALQAEEDPHREWDGFETEWDKLLARTHPDSHSEYIVFEHHTDLDPNIETATREILRTWDLIAYDRALSTNPQRTRSDLPPKSQQIFAALSRRQVESLLKRNTGSSSGYGETG